MNLVTENTVGKVYDIDFEAPAFNIYGTHRKTDAERILRVLNELPFIKAEYGVNITSRKISNARGKNRPVYVISIQTNIGTKSELLRYYSTMLTSYLFDELLLISKKVKDDKSKPTK